MNVQTEIRDGKLVIICDVSEKTLKAASPSKSQKSLLVATTNGFERHAGGIAISLNVTAPLPKA